jgi:hypothetical protein
MNSIATLSPNTIVEVPAFRSFPTLKACFLWVNSEILVRGVPVEASRVWYDRFKKPRSRYVKLFGVSEKAEKLVQRIAPGGQWSVEFHKKDNGYYQLSAWYNKFAPYALGMVQSEEGFACLGIDFETINCLYKTCLGFVGLGTGNHTNPENGYERIEAADVELFSRIFASSIEKWPPTLPFDEAFRPCAVFLAVRNPRLYAKQFCNKARPGYNRYHQHTLEVLTALNVPLPDGLPKQI